MTHTQGGSKACLCPVCLRTPGASTLQGERVFYTCLMLSIFHLSLAFSGYLVSVFLILQIASFIISLALEVIFNLFSRDSCWSVRNQHRQPCQPHASPPVLLELHGLLPSPKCHLLIIIAPKSFSLPPV